ncbi:acyl-CoA dehydratase activase [Chloroflexota bacterium]
MLTAGIDIGSKNIKVVILKDDREILAMSSVPGGIDQKASAEEALKAALQKAKVKRSDLEHIVSTGVGRMAAPYITGDVLEVGAAARGAHFLIPSTRVVVDVGAEEGMAARCDSKGTVQDFAINEKCAAGSGNFVETMARALELSTEEFAELSLKSKAAVPMNAQCIIFAESEVISLLHAKTPHADISRAIHNAIAERVSSMVRRVGIEKDLVLIGGVARNKGVVDALNRNLGVEVTIPEDPELVSALGAALSHN